MIMKRRQFLAGALALGAAPRLVLADVTADGFQEVRARPAALGLLETGEGRTEAWLFGPGPEPAVIRGKQGSEIRLRFVNDLDHGLWLHFFGVRGPSELMTIDVAPGQPVDRVFVPPDAGTFWIGPIADQSRARDMGLVAVLVIEEAAPAADLAEQVLVLDDWKLDDTGAVEGGFGDVETMVGEGRLGNWFTINNRFRPEIALDGGRVTRLRLLNAANVRVMTLMIKGDDPLLIARDGQPVKPGPLGGRGLVLAPGQRADLLVDPTGGQTRMALDLFEDLVEIGLLQPAAGAGPPAAVADNFALPANPVTALGPIAVARTVSLLIEGGIKGGLKEARFKGKVRDLRTLLENGKGWAINGVAGPAAEPVFEALKGETILIEVDNRTSFAQPIHIQGHVWQEIDEEPTGLWADTAVIPPGEQVTLGFTADNEGIWAIHSLVAERAEGGLFGSFVVKPASKDL
jgi:FtsP/CotA-like multicopper oxidase with cupredoxin domain